MYVSQSYAAKPCIDERLLSYTSLYSVRCVYKSSLRKLLYTTNPTQMSLVVIPKYNFEEMLKSIVRHRISHL